MRHPFQCLNIARFQNDAVRDFRLSIGIIRAATRFIIEQAAVRIRCVNIARFFIFEPDQTALATPITQALPLTRRHFAERFCLPEGRRDWGVG